MRIIRPFYYLILLCLSIILPTLSCAMTFAIPYHANVVGHVKTIKVPFGTSITELGQDHQIGYLEFHEANPNLNLQHLRAGSTLIVPSRYVLPKAPKNGIVINLPELRLYYYPSNRNIVITYPVGVGRKQFGSETPTMKSRIMQKRKNPIWIPTPDTRIEAYEKGITLPPFIEAGPENPLGDYAMRLGVTTYLIHGTNKPSGVGKRVSGGCIRMYPANVKQLFHLVNIGTHVNIVDQPFKAGWLDHKLYLEAHVPIDLKWGRTHLAVTEATRVIMPLIKNTKAHVDWKKVLRVANQQHGFPEVIGYRD